MSGRTSATGSVAPSDTPRMEEGLSFPKSVQSASEAIVRNSSGPARGACTSGGYTRCWMLRRLVPIVIAVALALAPVALEACQASCALHDAMSAASPAPEPPAGTHAVAASHQHGDAHTAHNHSARHDSGRDASAHDTGAHSCHGMTVPAPDVAAAPAITGGPHSCTHSDDLPLSAGAVLLVALTPASTVATVLDVPVYSESARLNAEVDTGSLSARISLIAQLRV